MCVLVWLVCGWYVARVWLVCGSTTAARHLAAAAAATSLDPPRSAATSSSSALWALGPGLLPGYIGATPQYSIIILISYSQISDLATIH